MQDALWAMAEATGTADSAGTAIDARLHHLTTITSLDPARIADEFERMHTVEMELAHSEGARQQLDEAESGLDNWHCDAKSALVGKLSHVRSHLDLVAANAAAIEPMVGAFHSPATQTRSSLLLLCHETTAAAVREIENQDKRDTKVRLAVGRR